MKSIAIFAAALVLAAPVVAQAPKTGAWQVGNDSYHLYYDDLDLTTLSGRATLLKRIEAVANKLCERPTRGEQEDCVEQVVAGLDSPAVAQARSERRAVALH